MPVPQAASASSGTGSTGPSQETTTMTTYRQERPRRARGAEHSIVYRNEREFCGWPFYCGLWRVGNGDLVTGFKRSEEHTSELQSLMRNSYAVFCLEKKKHKKINRNFYHRYKP